MYLRPRSRALSGCGCGLGDAASTLSIGSQTGPALPQSSVTPGQLLQAELNRFADPNAPAAYQYFSSPLTGGTVDSDTAARAIRLIVQRALDIEINTSMPSDGVAVMNEANTALYNGGAGPVPWVQQHITTVTQLVAGYADAHGLPPPTLPGMDLLTQVLIGAAVVFGGMALFGKRKPRPAGRRSRRYR